MRTPSILKHILTANAFISMVADSNKEEWSIPCMPNDEDLEPQPEDLEAMYKLLSNGSLLELQWKNPGRRQPSPAVSNDNEIDDTPEKETPLKKMEFDFMDEVAAPQMRVRSTNSTLKGSAKKKTANFAGVIDAIKKHGRLPSAASSPKDGT